MELIINNGNWGASHPKDIKEILTVAMSMMDSYYGGGIGKNIIINNDIKLCEPQVFYQKSIYGDYLMNISAKDNYWTQYCYQFFHEYCHIRMNYDLVSNKKYRWFDESIAELASIFGLLELSKIWNNKLPIFRGNNFYKSIHEYALREIDEIEMPINFKNWMKNNLESMEHDEYLREKNSIVAKNLLKLFIENKSMWKLLTFWNKWEKDEQDDIIITLTKWKNIVPNESKKDIENIINTLF